MGPPLFSLYQNYEKLADQLNLTTEKKSGEVIIEEVHASLDSDKVGDWLVIYDDLQPADREVWFPKGFPTRHQKSKKGHVLITSRSLHWDAAHLMKLAPFTPEEALDYLDKLLPTYFSEDKQTVTKLLGYHPLALTQAGGYIKYHPLKITIADYIKLFQEKRKEVLQRHSKNKSALDNYNHTVWTTVSLSLDILRDLTKEEDTRQSAKLAIELLQLGCLFAPGFAPSAIYKSYAVLHDYDQELMLPESLQLL